MSYMSDLDLQIREVYEKKDMDRRCPECHRFGMERREDGLFHCIWRDCFYFCTAQAIVLAKHPTFKKFREAIRRKR